jgi:hypothetical protein
MTSRRAVHTFVAFVLCAAPASAQTDSDRTPALAEPDFTLSALPTSLRLPAGQFAFRLTHRFARPIAAGSFGDFVSDFFGFDSSAQIGIEVRYGVAPGTQVLVHRTNDRAIQFYGQHQVHRQQDSMFVALDAFLAVEGANNFRQDYAQAAGAVVSHRFGEQGAVYVQPTFVRHVVPDDPEVEDEERDAFLLGVGGRVRLGLSKVYLVAEAAPRLSGYDNGVHHVSVGIERRAGGHVFQLNVSNSLGTTLRQLASGGPASSDWFIGFNLTRKFY